MTEPAPEEQPHPWLPASRVLAWLQLTELAGTSPEDDRVTTAEDCRRAAADHLETQRRDLWTQPTLEDGEPAFDATEGVVTAGVLVAARLFARRSSPAGLASYGEFGAAEVLRLDPDVARMAGLGRNAYPRLG